jgi:alpha-L-fucosidase 2
MQLSLFDLVKRVCENGKKTAEIMYGCRGSVCHHNTDFYGDTAPQDQYMASTAWTLGGAWMAMHIWDHYTFTKDVDFLREYYPVMREFGLFFLDFLVDDGEGFLVTNPSLSPENRYILPDGYDSPICAGPAMDNQILRDLFGAIIESAKILGIDDELLPDFAATRERLPKDKIGSQGQLLEWREELPEKMPGMSHISHLYAAYPSDQINWRDTPELMKAVAKSIELRVAAGADPGAWPLAWRICQYARQGDGEKVGIAVNNMISKATESFMNGARIFQIDGNLGAAAGIAEALLDSQTGILRLLPALPTKWQSGSVKGLMARNAIRVDMAWDGGALTEATLYPKFDGEIEIKTEKGLYMSCDGEDVATEKTQYGVKFSAVGGKVYTLR